MTLEEQIKADEGFRRYPYEDTAGKLSIGYGRNLTDVGVSQAEAEILLRNDIEIARSGLMVRFPIVSKLAQTRQDALITMSYNLGITRLSRFKKMWAAIAAYDFERAADEMLNSTWATEVGERAVRLAGTMRTGQ